MDFSLNEDQRAWQMKARQFAQVEIRPLSLKRDRITDPRETFDWDIIRKGSKLGFRTLAVAKKWGGHGADLVTQAIVMAELAKADSAISKTFSQCWKWSQLITTICTPEQQERFIRPFIEDDTYLLGAAQTEPNASSDNRLPPENDPRSGWKLKAERHGDEWILNGEKCLIANGGVGKLFFVNTRTDPNVSIKLGTTTFLVPSSTPGFRVGKVFNKNGWRFYQNAELIFENARVPHANLVGEVNGGVKARSRDLSQFGDIELAANALGICDAAVEMAMQYAQTRSRQSRPLAGHQTIQLRLSEMHVLTEALRSFVLRTAWERQLATRGDQPAGKFVNAQFVMIFSKTAVQRVTRLNMDVHRVVGAMDQGAEKLSRDAAIWTHLAGSTLLQIKSIKDLLSSQT
jgi:alkylation response protein AidB-like acyl-CoA dehydrogenase